MKNIKVIAITTLVNFLIFGSFSAFQQGKIRGHKDLNDILVKIVCEDPAKFERKDISLEFTDFPFETEKKYQLIKDEFTRRCSGDKS